MASPDKLVSAVLMAPNTASEAFAEILDAVGANGRWQWYMFFVTSVWGSTTALHSIGAVFLAAEPEHWCAIPALDAVALSTGLDLRNASIPWLIGSDGKEHYSKCYYYLRNYTEVIAALPTEHSAPVLSPPQGTNTTTCEDWNYDTSVFTNTVVTKWNLVCADEWLKSTIQSSYMAGMMVGSLVLSVLADSFGRRKIMLWSLIFLSISVILTDFSSTYLMYILMRFFTAVFCSGVTLTLFVILMEELGVATRTKLGGMQHMFFPMGMCILAGLSYLQRDWMHLQITISAITLLGLVYFFLVPESPRWLMMQGRHEEAMHILRKMARMNSGALPNEKRMQLLTNTIDKETGALTRITNKEKWRAFLDNQMSLIRTPNMRRRFLVMSYVFLVMTIVYFGLPFNGENLNLSLHLLVFITGVVEFISSFFGIWLLNRVGRRISLAISLVMSGIPCLIIFFIPVELSVVNLVISAIGLFFANMAFNISFLYSAEVTPTSVRNAAVGIFCMFGRAGGVVTPYIVDLLGAVHYGAPSMVFGLLAVTAGLLSLLLPETGDMRLPESIEEIEAMPR